MRKIDWGGIALVSFLFGLIGALAGCFAVSEIDYGKWQWWQPLGKPGAGAIKFLKMEPNWNNQSVVTYVEDSNGNTFRRSTLPDSQWEQVSPPTDKGTSGCDYFPYPVSKPPTFSNLPSKVVNCDRMQWSWEWVANDDFTVILSDGSVWKWHYYQGIDQSLRFGCGIPITAIVIGWLVVALIGKRQTSKNNIQ